MRCLRGLACKRAARARSAIVCGLHAPPSVPCSPQLNSINPPFFLFFPGVEQIVQIACAMGDCRHRDVMIWCADWTHLHLSIHPDGRQRRRLASTHPSPNLLCPSALGPALDRLSSVRMPPRSCVHCAATAADRVRGLCLMDGISFAPRGRKHQSD